MNKIIATRCHILRIICTNFDSCWGSAKTRQGELTALPNGVRLDLRGPTSKGKEGKGRGCCEGNGREERKGPISESQPPTKLFPTP